MALSLKERTRWAINYVAEKDGLSNTKIGAQLGIKGDTVSSYRSMATDPKVEFIAKFCETYNFDLTWFVSGAGAPFSGARDKYPEVCGETGDLMSTQELMRALEEEEHAAIAAQREPLDRESAEEEPGDILIPAPMPFDPTYFDFVPMAEAHLAAGGGAFVLSEKFKEYYAFRKDWLRRIGTRPKRLVMMPIKGTSMQPTIMDGDVVMLDTGRRRIFDGQIYALGMGETIMVKRLENLVGGRVRIIADNRTEFPPYEAEARDIRIIGQVIWFARELVPRE
ncbi:MAG: hypothetical protein CVU57_04195 [Deltaproteobacteria bacterium HGW-Deltaproteobacteria-15]|jgi:phage repressor protein C with HTH and peptisase S24 domain|nr:MAG: hypothetical protein CVU57_04195 [Deltaproteobacteria bacterium HGW-Deltaproteobacteria-15]